MELFQLTEWLNNQIGKIYKKDDYFYFLEKINDNKLIFKELLKDRDYDHSYISVDLTDDKLLKTFMEYVPITETYRR